MDYIELKFNITNPNPILELLKQELGDIGFDSFEDHPESISAFIDKSIFSKRLFDKTISPYSIYFKSVDYIDHPFQNWNEKWESSFEPILINDDCLIRASFHSSKSLKYEIIIDPEMSFGTGHHETTRLMSSYLLENPPRNKKVLDFGSGTGVLSILSEKLKASSINSVEIDQLAVSNAINNGRINNCNKIKFIHGSGDSIPNMAYDLILANINKNTIMSQWDYLLRVSNEKTSIVLSGFYKQDLLDLIQFSSTSGLIPLYSNLENNWAILILKYAKNDA